MPLQKTGSGNDGVVVGLGDQLIFIRDQPVEDTPVVEDVTEPEEVETDPALNDVFFAFDKHNIDPLLSVVFVMPTLFLFGVAVYQVLFRRIEGSKKFGEMTVLLTFGIAIMVEGLLGFVFTGIYRKAQPGYANESFIVDGLFLPQGDILFIPKGQFYASLMSIVLLVGLWHSCAIATPGMPSALPRRTARLPRSSE